MQSSPDVQGFALPDVVNPSGSICFQVNVPNDPGHIKAFLGVLYDLTLWVSWQRDATHRGVQAAQVWKKIWTDLEDGGCEVITFQQPDDCTLQVSYDDGVTWTTIYNALDCAIGAADSEITRFLADGILGGPVQPGPQPAPLPTQCFNYHVTLQANAPWKIPVALSDGWTVGISNVSGATYDGTFTPFWYCPDGGWFLLGACGGSPTTEASDPLPTTDHMALILQAGTVFSPILSGPYTVPSGTGAIDGIFQVNDSVLTDNGGTIEFDLEVCSAGWCIHFDFTASDGGFVYTGNYGTYVPGVGWQATDWAGHTSPYAKAIEASLTASAPFTLSSYTIEWAGTSDTGNGGNTIGLEWGGGCAHYAYSPLYQAGVQPDTGPQSYTPPDAAVLSISDGVICIYAETYETGSPPADRRTITGLTLYGLGTAPTIGSSC